MKDFHRITLCRVTATKQNPEPCGVQSELSVSSQVSVAVIAEVSVLVGEAFERQSILYS